MKKHIMVLGILAAFLLAVFAAYAAENSTWGRIKATFKGDSSLVAKPVPGGIKVLIGFKEAPDPDLVRGLGGRVKHTYGIIPAVAAEVPAAVVSKLAANHKVAYVEQDVKLHTLDDELDNSWGVNRIDAEVVHNMPTPNKGAGVKVAIIDTGIDSVHQDLVNNCQGGIGYKEGVAVGSWDDHGHGTHVAGIVAAEDNEIGVVGVAPEAHLYAVKVFHQYPDGYYAYGSDVIAGIEWCILGLDGVADADDDIQVINMSLGGPGSSRSLEDACDAAYTEGIVLVAAAGNYGRTIPAAFASVIAVAGSDRGDKIPSWWSHGRYVELTAPGVDVTSTLPGNSYGEMSGTSMASPHVAGTVALMIAGGVSDIRTTLQNTADRLMRNAHVEYPSIWQGYGLVDAEEAVLVPEEGNDLPLPVE